MSELYADILRRARPESTRHPRMSLADRAVQFAPFAALTGYDDAVEEAARLFADQAEQEECSPSYVYVPGTTLLP